MIVATLLKNTKPRNPGNFSKALKFMKTSSCGPKLKEDNVKPKEDILRLLLVEDEPALSRYVKKGLEENGHAVDTATDGLTALEAARGSCYDVMILDLLLPKLGGVEVCRRLRAEKNTTPILMLTALDAVGDRVKGLDAGADDYLAKPFEFDELMARLRSVSRRLPGMVKSTVLQLGKLQVDTATHEVIFDGQTIALPGKEYAILELLLRQPGRIYSRDNIADRIWNRDTWHESNVVEVHIKTLRQRLGPLGGKMIQTLRGLGYRLIEPSRLVEQPQ